MHTRARLFRSTRPSPWLVLAGTWLGSAWLGASCKPHGESSISFSHTAVDSEGGGEVTFNGVHIEFDDTVHYLYRSTSSNLGVSQITKTVNGNEFGLRASTFFIGEREYGTVAPGAHVRVTKDGVTVDGEARGPLPESRGG